MKTAHVKKRFHSGLFLIVGTMFCGCSQDFIEQTEYQIRKCKEDEIAPHYQKDQNSEYWHCSPSKGDGGFKKIQIDSGRFPSLHP